MDARTSNAAQALEAATKNAKGMSGAKVNQKRKKGVKGNLGVSYRKERVPKAARAKKNTKNFKRSLGAKGMHKKEKCSENDPMVMS